MKKTEPMFYQAGAGALIFITAGLIIGACIIAICETWQHAGTTATSQAITADDLQDRLREAQGYAAVLETIKYYQQNQDDNGYSQNADHLLKVWNFCAIYADTITDPRWIDTINQPAAYREKLKAQICSIDVPLFMFCACADESAYMPGAIGTNKNKTQDIGITQINQGCHAEINPLLPPDLRTRAWTDTEKKHCRALYMDYESRQGRPGMGQNDAAPGLGAI
jgi:hypothetical protein